MPRRIGSSRLSKSRRMKNAESKVETLEQENTDLKKQAERLSGAEKRLSELQKDRDAAKSRGEEAKTQAVRLEKDYRGRQGPGRGNGRLGVVSGNFFA